MDRITAERLLKEAKNLNDGAWVKHSCNVECSTLGNYQMNQLYCMWQNGIKEPQICTKKWDLRLPVLRGFGQPANKKSLLFISRFIEMSNETTYGIC